MLDRNFNIELSKEECSKLIEYLYKYCRTRDCTKDFSHEEFMKLNEATANKSLIIMDEETARFISKKPNLVEQYKEQKIVELITGTDPVQKIMESLTDFTPQMGKWLHNHEVSAFVINEIIEVSKAINTFKMSDLNKTMSSRRDLANEIFNITIKKIKKNKNVSKDDNKIIDKTKQRLQRECKENFEVIDTFGFKETGYIYDCQENCLKYLKELGWDNNEMSQFAKKYYTNDIYSMKSLEHILKLNLYSFGQLFHQIKLSSKIDLESLFEKAKFIFNKSIKENKMQEGPESELKIVEITERCKERVKNIDNFAISPYMLEQLKKECSQNLTDLGWNETAVNNLGKMYFKRTSFEIQILHYIIKNVKKEFEKIEKI